MAVSNEDFLKALFGGGNSEETTEQPTATPAPEGTQGAQSNGKVTNKAFMDALFGAGTSQPAETTAQETTTTVATPKQTPEATTQKEQPTQADPAVKPTQTVPGKNTKGNTTVDWNADPAYQLQYALQNAVEGSGAAGQWAKNVVSNESPEIKGYVNGTLEAVDAYRNSGAKNNELGNHINAAISGSEADLNWLMSYYNSLPATQKHQMDSTISQVRNLYAQNSSKDIVSADSVEKEWRSASEKLNDAKNELYAAQQDYITMTSLAGAYSEEDIAAAQDRIAKATTTVLKATETKETAKESREEKIAQINELKDAVNDAKEALRIAKKVQAGANVAEAQKALDEAELRLEMKRSGTYTGWDKVKQTWIAIDRTAGTSFASFLSGIGDMVLGGQLGDDLWSLIGQTINMFGANVDLNVNPITAWNDKNKANAEWANRVFSSSGYATQETKAAQNVFKYGTMVWQQAPTMLLSLMTLGVSSGATVTTEMLTAASAMAESSYAVQLAKTVGGSVVNMFKDPQYWLSFIMEAGGTYNEAVADGMSKEEAATYATTYGLISAMIEIGGVDEELGGIQSKSLMEALKRGDFDAYCRELAKSTLGEISEEWSQQFFQTGLMSFWGKSVPWYMNRNGKLTADLKWEKFDNKLSWEEAAANTEAAINPIQMAQTALDTAITTLLMGGSERTYMSAVTGLQNMITADSGISINVNGKWINVNKISEAMAADMGFKSAEDARAYVYADVIRKAVEETGKTIDQQAQENVGQYTERAYDYVMESAQKVNDAQAAGDNAALESAVQEFTQAKKNYEATMKAVREAMQAAERMNDGTGSNTEAAGDDLPGGGQGRADAQGAGVANAEVSRWANQPRAGTAAAQRQSEINQIRNAAKNLPEQTALSLGLTDGDERYVFHVLTDEIVNSQENLRSMREKYEAEGYKVNFLDGSMSFSWDVKNNETGEIKKKTLEANGIFRNGNIYVNAAHLHSALSIMEHEVYHGEAKNDPGLVDATISAIKAEYSDEEINRILNAYQHKLWYITDIDRSQFESEEAFQEAVKEAEDSVWEEILADANGRKNSWGFGAPEFHDTVERVLQDRKSGIKNQQQQQANETRGPPGSSMSMDDEEGLQLPEAEDRRGRWDTDKHRAMVAERVQNGEALSTRDEVAFSLDEDATLLEEAAAWAETHGDAKLAEQIRGATAEQRAEIQQYMQEHFKELGLPNDTQYDKKHNTLMGNDSYGKSLENLTVCIRSLFQDEVVRNVERKLGRPLSINESMYVIQVAGEYTKTPQCAYCYVAADRMAFNNALGQILKERDMILEAATSGKTLDETLRMVEKASGLKKGALKPAKGMDGPGNTNSRYDRTCKWYELAQSGKYLSGRLSARDLGSFLYNDEEIAKKRATLKREAQLIDFDYAIAYAKSASHAKKRTSYVSYNGEILKMDNDLVDLLNSEFGLRMYSYSDYSPAFILENMQMVTDAAARGLKMLAYTKEMDFVRIFAPTGMNINISVFGFETNGVIGEDNMQGASWAEAQALREQYPNVGITFVTTSDTLSNYAKQLDWVDVVLPYHSVFAGGGAVAKYNEYRDHKAVQADKAARGHISEAKAKQLNKAKQIAAEHGLSTEEFDEVIPDAKEVFPTVHDNNFRKYFEALKKEKLQPRFAEQLVDYDLYKKGAIDIAEFERRNPYYMKFVNETRRAASQTPAVQPVFNTEAAMASLKQMEAEGGYDAISKSRAVSMAASDAAEGIKKGVVGKTATESMKNRVEMRGQQSLSVDDQGNEVHLVKDGILTEKSTDQERYEMLRNLVVRYAEFTEEKLKGNSISRIDELPRNKASKELANIAEKLGMTNVDFDRSELGFSFRLSKTNARVSTNHQIEDHKTKVSDLAKAIACLDEIVEYAVPIEVHEDYKRGTKKENTDLDKVYVLVGAYKDGADLAPVEIEVKAFRANTAGMYLVVTLNKIEFDVIESPYTGLTVGTNSLLPNSTISLSSILQNVNPKDGKFLKYVPDGFLDEQRISAKRAELEKQKREYPETRMSQDDGLQLPGVDYASMSYAEISMEQQKVSQQERELSQRKRKASEDQELLDATMAYSDIIDEMKTLMAKRHKGTATEEELARLEEVKQQREQAIANVEAAQEKVGLKEIAEQERKLRDLKEELRKAADAAWEREGAEKENRAIKKSGLSAEEYFRKKALKEFKTTSDFREAGYMLPDGKMLNFSGGERGVRHRDHREIGEIYEATQQTAALNRFLADGNIRIMAESPGIDIAAGVEPTKEQYARIREMVRKHGSEAFYVDISGEDGRRVGRYSYGANTNADRVLNDIRYFYQTGETRQQQSWQMFSQDDSDGNRLTTKQQKYFENSVIRNKEGKLLKVYHGTPAKSFNYFSYSKAGNVGGALRGYGFYFTASKREASMYAQGIGHVKEGYLNITNPINGTDNDLAQNVIGILEKLPYSTKQEIIENFGSIEEAAKGFEKYDNATMLAILPRHIDALPQVVNGTLMKMGYDGIVYDDGEYEAEYIAFESNQFKNANNRMPTETDDIRFSQDEGLTPQQVNMAAMLDQAAQLVAEGKSPEYIFNSTGFVRTKEGRLIDPKTGKTPTDPRTGKAYQTADQAAKAEERKRKLAEGKKEAAKDINEAAKKRAAKWEETDATEVKATVSKKNFRQQMEALFSTPDGRRGEIGKILDEFAERVISKGGISERDRNALLDAMWDAGEVRVQATNEAKYNAEAATGISRIYVNDIIKGDFGEDWNAFRRRAFAAGIYLVNDINAPGVDVVNQGLAQSLPARFSEDSTDMKEVLEAIVDTAEEGRSERMTLDEYTRLAAAEGGVSYEELVEELERKADKQIELLAQAAGLELYMKKQNQSRLRFERAKATERRIHEERMRVQKAELQKLQQQTLQSLQWLSRNRNKAPEDLRAAFEQVLSDIDIYAIGAANAARWDGDYEMTWEQLAQLYKDAKQNDPNFLPSQELEKVVARIDNRKIADMDVDALMDLYKAATALRTELYNRNNIIADEEHRMFSDAYEGATEEIGRAMGHYQGAGIKKAINELFNMGELTPTGVLRRMAGWRKGTWSSFVDMLENGERAAKAYEVEAKAMLQDFIKENEEWLAKADGQGDDGIWYEVEFPELMKFRMGDQPIFGRTVKVSMTPLQKVQLYLESKSTDNLRHMTGGRTFVNKELYSKGNRQEALAQGTIIRMAPETAKRLTEDLTPQEMQLATLLERYYNQFAKGKINKVSNTLYGYDKAMSVYYAPIFTDHNYNKSTAGTFDTTAEGVGHMKGRIHGVNPSYNISALDGFERHIRQTSRFVGYSIPVRNWETLINWYQDGGSMKKTIANKWGEEGLNYIMDTLTNLQSKSVSEEGIFDRGVNKILSKYISSIFGFNPGVMFKQFASFPQFAAELGWENMPSPAQLASVDTELISKYTKERDFRLLGYSTPETAVLKNNPSKLSRNPVFGFVFGGKNITWMDGFTVEKAWPWAENYVKKNFPDLKPGAEDAVNAGVDPYYKKVAEVYNNAVAMTQPMYDYMHRANIMRQTGAVTRTFTMFKTVPFQQYNNLRRNIGELQAANEDLKEAMQGKNDAAIKGAKAAQQKAARKMTNTVTATLASTLCLEAINLVDQYIRNGLKSYKDDDDELTAESVIKEFVARMVKDMNGMVIAGGEVTDFMNSIFTGDKWYGIELPGGAQLNDMVDAIAEAVEAVKGIANGAVNVAQEGGDVSEYLHKNGRDYAGAIKDIAINFSTYFAGFPAANIEKYLKGIMQKVAPAAYAAMQDAFDTPSKSDLKGKTGAELKVTIGDIYENRRLEISKDTRNELARLKEAGYDSIISTAPASMSMDGESVKLTDYQQQVYDLTLAEAMSGKLDELIASDEYREAEDGERAAMIADVYKEAKNKAATVTKAELNEAPTREDLDKLEGEELATGTLQYLSGRGIKLDKAACEEIARLVEHGHDNALVAEPSGMSKYDAIVYDEAVGGKLAKDIQKLLQSEEYGAETDSGKAAMLEKLYGYAQQAAEIEAQNAGRTITAKSEFAKAAADDSTDAAADKKTLAQVYADRGINLSNSVVTALYDAYMLTGKDDFLLTAAPSSVTVDGVSYSLDAYQKKVYDEVLAKALKEADLDNVVAKTAPEDMRLVIKKIMDAAKKTARDAALAAEDLPGLSLPGMDD